MWREQEQRLRSTEALKIYNERLKRQWAIETGIIEGLYSIDRGTTQLLIELGFEASLIPHGATDKPPQRIVQILGDQRDALDLLFDFVKGTRPLSTSYIKELHALFTRHQPTTEAVDALGNRVEVALLRDEWKKLPNNPKRNGHVFLYCPPEHVGSEMDHLLALHASHSDVCPEVAAAWFHHRFTQIHPFQDGNGRLARALASLIFIRARWFPLTITRDDREHYIQALERADQGDLAPLTGLFGRIEKNACLRAISLAAEVVREQQSYRDVLQAAIQRLRERVEGAAQSYGQVAELGNQLAERATQRLGAAAADLQGELAPLGFSALLISDRGRDQLWHVADTIEIAKRHGYFADYNSFYRWVRLSIHEVRSFEIVVTFHAIGREPSGVIAAVAFAKQRESGPDGERAVHGPDELNDDLFQITYTDTVEQLQPRFDRWLESALLNGLETWRRGI